ncbi:putative glycosyltransferase [Dietzia cinnamea P4]|nr:putative glycosyltransferase [Dietzia cinnamea P4]
MGAVAGGNRGARMTPSTSVRGGIDVVIPYYRDQRMLDRILAALRGQTGLDHRGALRVIVADDGSPTPPTVPPDVTVVRQDDRGFRASAARHLGAEAGDGELLLFLDGDTVPGPGYVAAMCEALEGRPDLLVVGRRRYGRFPDRTTAVEPAEILPDPEWPAGYYAETANLTRGEDLWRGVLSAVCGLHRRLYDLAGGFDPDIVGYGGEDWDLAWRCEQAGGRLLYVPDAVAWHDGPDWSGRAGADGEREAADPLAQKNAETARLAPLIASTLTRPAGGIYALPSIAVHVRAADPAFGGTGTAAATCASLLTLGDVAVTVDPATSDAAVIAELFADDPRVVLRPRSPWWRPGTLGAGPRRRPPVLVDIHRPCALGALDARRLRALCPPEGSVILDDDEGRTLARIRSSRALAREQEWGERPPAARSIAASGVGVRGLGGDGDGVRLERIIAGW